MNAIIRTKNLCKRYKKTTALFQKILIENQKGDLTMNKLLSMELKRAAKFPVLWLGVIAVIAMNVYEILLNEYGFKIYTTTFLFQNSALECIVLAVLIPLYMGHDFENRTINNKISSRYTRKEIYIVELIVSSICATVLFIADITSVFISSNIAGLEFSDKVNVPEFAFHATIAFVCIITVSNLYTMITMISHKQLISLGISIILALALLTLGGKSVSSLNQSSTWIDPVTHETVENPLRIDGFARTANNLHVLISPFAQAEFHSHMLSESELGIKEETSLIFKDFPYHIEFCLFNILEILLFYNIGLRIFRKQDLIFRFLFLLFLQ